jgi:hypothetical protein
MVGQTRSIKLRALKDTLLEMAAAEAEESATSISI